MITRQEQFRRIIRGVQEEFGYVHPDATPQRLVAANIAPPLLTEPIRREIIHHPTREHLFPGVIPTFSTLVAHGAMIRIWSDDLEARIEEGLKEIQDELLPREKHRFGIAVEENNKSSLLPGLLQEAQELQLPAIVVENSKENLLLAAYTHKRMSLSNPLILLWANMYTGEGENGYRFDGSHGVIIDVSQLLLVQETIGGEGYYIVDYNDTVHNKRTHEGTMIENVWGMIFSAQEHAALELALRA